ncbi:MAG TPA: hypothetical protein VKY15_08200, partial [Acidimicrobiales bacterium]|nr:hypothetical protein [Acidimicrobiales bacterium]
VSLEVTVGRPGGQRAESVPVVWPGAPAIAEALDAGEAVVVAGRVRRRFFTAAGQTQSRTELVADAVVPQRRAASASGLLRGAVSRLLAEAAALG